MMRLAAGVVASLIYSTSLLAQGQDRSLERIAIGLQQPSIVRGVTLPDIDLPKKVGIVTFVQPVLRGEAIRVSVPVGEYVSRAFSGIAAANQRRKANAARRRVDAALNEFLEQQRR